MILIYTHGLPCDASPTEVVIDIIPSPLHNLHNNRSGSSRRVSLECGVYLPSQRKKKKEKKTKKRTGLFPLSCCVICMTASRRIRFGRYDSEGTYLIPWVGISKKRRPMKQGSA